MDNLKRSNQKVNLLIITFLIISFVSCIPQKRLVLMQSENIIDSTYANTFDGSEFEDSVYRIQPNDYLYINISSVEKKITDFFAPLTAVNYISGENQALTGYAVNDKGNIEFPYVGTIHLQGQTLEECVETMRLATAKYVGKARIEIRLINNTISVLGEVEKQGVYRMTKSKIDIYEAITLASGFKDFAKRNKVKDNGEGIPSNVLDKIFQPFFTTKPSGEGTGLGLSLGYDIIKSHGGELKVESEEGNGTTFIIYLPLK